MLSVTQRDPKVPWEQRGEQLAGGSGEGSLELSLQVVARSYATGLHTLGQDENTENSSRVPGLWESPGTWDAGQGGGGTLTGGQLEIPPLPKKNSSLCTTMEVCLQRREETE